MPPKAKRGKAATKQKKAGIPLDEVDTTTLTRDKLEEYCITVHESFSKEKQYSEFLRLERDKLSDLLEIARGQLVSLRNSNRAREYELQEAEDSQRQFMGETRQNVTHLASEKNMKCIRTTLETVGVVNYEKKCHEERMSEIDSDINALETECRFLNKNLSNKIKKLEIEFAENKFQVQEKNKELQILMENKRDKIVNNEVQRLNQKFKEEHNDLKKRKTHQITQLITRHTKFTIDLKNYYNKIVSHNLSVIFTMKLTFQEEKTATAALDKELAKLKKENIYIETTLQQSQYTEMELNEKLTCSKRDQNELKITKLQLQRNSALLDNIKLELDAVNIRLSKQEALMNKRASEDEQLMFTERGRAEELILVLEYMVSHLCHRINETEAALEQVIGSVTECDTVLDELRYELTTMAQQRDCMLATYTQLLHKYHIHPDDTGFQVAGVDHILKAARSLRVLVHGRKW